MCVHVGNIISVTTYIGFFIDMLFILVYTIIIGIFSYAKDTS